MIRFDDSREVLDILIDTETHLAMQERKGIKTWAGTAIRTRIKRVLKIYDNTKLSGEANENIKQKEPQKN